MDHFDVNFVGTKEMKAETSMELYGLTIGGLQWRRLLSSDRLDGALTSRWRQNNTSLGQRTTTHGEDIKSAPLAPVLEHARGGGILLENPLHFG
jgi:hypothetical protein